jgi:WD40 repeat protein
VVTGSADKTVKVFDISAGMQCIGTMEASAIVCCGTIHENVAIAGCGDGSAIFYDLDQMKCAFGFGAASDGPVNCLKLNRAHDRLVAGGENGHGLVMFF